MGFGKWFKEKFPSWYDTGRTLLCMKDEEGGLTELKEKYPSSKSGVTAVYGAPRKKDVKEVLGSVTEEDVAHFQKQRGVSISEQGRARKRAGGNVSTQQAVGSAVPAETQESRGKPPAAPQAKTQPETKDTADDSRLEITEELKKLQGSRILEHMTENGGVKELFYLISTKEGWDTDLDCLGLDTTQKVKFRYNMLVLSAKAVTVWKRISDEGDYDIIKPEELFA